VIANNSEWFYLDVGAALLNNWDKGCSILVDVLNVGSASDEGGNEDMHVRTKASVKVPPGFLKSVVAVCNLLIPVLVATRSAFISGTPARTIEEKQTKMREVQVRRFISKTKQG